MKDDGFVVDDADAGELGGLAAGQRVIAVDRAEIAAARTLRRRIDGALERIFHIRRRHGAAIVEFDAVAQLERIGQAVIGDRVALGEVGLELGRAGLVVHEPVEDRLDDRPVLPVIADLRIESGEIVVEGDDGGAALFRALRQGDGRGSGEGQGGGGSNEEGSHIKYLPGLFYL